MAIESETAHFMGVDDSGKEIYNIANERWKGERPVELSQFIFSRLISN
jgi:hypothetical protein